MTIKEIWENFMETAKGCIINAGESVCNVAKETWCLFKNDMVDFIKAVFVWLTGLVEGVARVLWNTLTVICSALLAAIKSTLGVVCQWIIDWIKHL